MQHLEYWWFLVNSVNMLILKKTFSSFTWYEYKRGVLELNSQWLSHSLHWKALQKALWLWVGHLKSWNLAHIFQGKYPPQLRHSLYSSKTSSHFIFPIVLRSRSYCLPCFWNGVKWGPGYLLEWWVSNCRTLERARMRAFILTWLLRGFIDNDLFLLNLFENG